MNSRTLMLFLTAVVLAVFAVLIAQRWVESMGGGAVQQVEYGRVVVASMDIPQWKTVGEKDVTEKNWPKEAVTKEMFTEKSQVVGKVAISNVFTDEPLIARRVVDPKGGNVFSLGFSENKRAFTVRVNDVSGVGGFLLPDNHVDVLHSWKPSGMNDEVHSETLVQDVRVLAVDQEASSEKNKPIVVRSVTLEMTPEQAEAVFRAEEQGSIQLALRNPTDKTLIEKPETTARAPVFPEPRAEAPKAALPRGKTFTVIRGMSQSRIQCQGNVCSEQLGGY
ncbi:MAG: Flp pilus assembly protein CpaB [Methylococcaceae bacterium]|nr:Flp pilus assembly protein CpaB [Methylococcaceae bacterium]